MKTTFLALLILVGLLTPIVSIAQTDTTFTYQGELQQNNVPANGAFNMEFSLWNVAADGSQVGTSNLLNGVPVTEGNFTVELDFNADVFDNSNRWLEVVVDGTTLMPRNLITRVPYAIQTRGIFVDDNYNVAIGAAIPEAQLHVQANNNTTLRLENDLAPDSFTALRNDSGTRAVLQKINQAGDVLIDIDPLPFNGASDASIRLFRSTNTSGLKRVLFNRGNGTTQTSAVIGLDGADSYFQIQGGNVGIGTASPNYKLHVETDNLRAISGHTTVVNGTGVYGSASSTVGANYGVYGTTDSAGGVVVFGEVTNPDGIGDGLRGISNCDLGRGVCGRATSPDGNGTIGVYGETVGGIGVEGRATAESGINFGVLGQSFSPDGFDFYAGGSGTNYGSPSSRRWKSNIVSIDQSLEKISKLRGVSFDWDKEHGGQHDIGMIAEDVGKVLPQVVQYEENGVDALGMDYSMLTPLLVEAVKALRQEKDAEISELKLQNHEMQQQIQDLKRAVEQLASTDAGAAK